MQKSFDRPVVIIIGAGIGGLTMALLLEQIDYPYHVFERAAEVKPLGSAMSFGGNILLVFEQLGIYEDLRKVGKPYDDLNFFDGKGRKIGDISLETNLELSGYRALAFSRPEFYDVLRKRVPNSKISYKKKILKTEEKEGKVIIHCSDNTSYQGDILIGADGAYSGVRQSMYKRMDEQEILPKVDLEAFSIGYTVVVGVTKAMDPEKYPILKEDSTSFNQIVYNDTSNCYIFPLPNNRLSWGFGSQLPRSVLEEMHFRNSEWSAEKSESTLSAFRDHPNPLGGTMGEMFDATPKELISKVYLEEKIFKTWYHGRTVLLGDACHKMHPAGGQGASNAVLDAVSLANSLYFMKDKSTKSINKAFEDYYNHRFPHAEKAFLTSSGLSKLLNGQKFVERAFRKFVLNCIPSWVFNASFKKTTAYRPQVAWLPLLTNRGTIKSLPQQWEKQKDATDIKTVAV